MLQHFRHRLGSLAGVAGLIGRGPGTNLATLLRDEPDWGGCLPGCCIEWQAEFDPLSGQRALAGRRSSGRGR